MVSRAAKLTTPVSILPDSGASPMPEPDGFEEIAPETVAADDLTVLSDPEFADIPPDGEAIDLNPSPVSASPKHDDNLAEFLPESVLSKLGADVNRWIEEDKKTRAQWDAMLSEGIDSLGLVIEDREFPFSGASGVYDTVMLEAVIRDQAIATAELIPAEGPVKTQIVGMADEASEQKAKRVKAFMNFYLTEGAPEWTDDNAHMLFWRALAGSMFKKTYQHPILNRPVSESIMPQNFIVSMNTKDLDTCPRATHLIPMTARELKMRQISGFYRNIALQEGEHDGDGSDILKDTIQRVEGLSKGVDSNPGEPDADYDIAEQHVDLDLEGYEHENESDETDLQGNPVTEKSGLPLPYIVTIDRVSGKVLAVRRNWAEDDKTYQKNQYFTHFRFLPGLGFYGIGYAHILGNSAVAATGLERQMQDAETLAMYPGGLRVKGMKLADNNIMIGPGQFNEIDTGGLPINQAITPMPYKGASPIAFELWKAIRENARSLGSMTEIAVGEGRQDAPVGTTVALMEAANRVQSATIKNAHRAYRREFKLLAALFGEYLPEEPYPFPVAGGAMHIMRADFSDDVDVLPVSDPNINSSAQRMMRAEVVWRSAMEAPQYHDLYQAARQRYVEMGLGEGRIDAILPPPQQAQPLDPLTENQNALTGKPLKAAPWQDHDAHIKGHAVLAEQVPAIQAHIAEHLALKSRVEVEKMLGIQLPPPEMPLPPQLQNQIAVMVANALEIIANPTGPSPTPEQIAWEQLRLQAKEIDAKLTDIRARSQLDAFKAQKQYISDERERQTRERIARERNATQREIARMRERTNAIGKQPKQFN